jgi:hypothetical protein
MSLLAPAFQDQSARTGARLVAPAVTAAFHLAQAHRALAFTPGARLHDVLIASVPFL